VLLFDFNRNCISLVLFSTYCKLVFETHDVSIYTSIASRGKNDKGEEGSELFGKHPPYPLCYASVEILLWTILDHSIMLHNLCCVFCAASREKET